MGSRTYTVKLCESNNPPNPKRQRPRPTFTTYSDGAGDMGSYVFNNPRGAVPGSLIKPGGRRRHGGATLSYANQWQ